jgi:hypothetical protein
MLQSWVRLHLLLYLAHCRLARQDAIILAVLARAAIPILVNYFQTLHPLLQVLLHGLILNAVANELHDPV